MLRDGTLLAGCNKGTVSGKRLFTLLKDQKLSAMFAARVCSFCPHDLQPLQTVSGPVTVREDTQSSGRCHCMPFTRINVELLNPESSHLCFGIHASMSVTAQLMHVINFCSVQPLMN